MTKQVTLADFKRTANGVAVGAVLARRETIAAMEDLSYQGRPAVLAVERALDGEVVLDELERRHVGRWVRDVLADRGWRPRKRGHFRAGRLFSSGAVYEQSGAPAWFLALPPPSPEVIERVRRVQEMARPFHGENGFSVVDELIAERHAEAARELDEP